MNKILRHLFVVFIIPALMARVTLATTSNWVGPGSDFNTATNWDAAVPTDVAGFNNAIPTSISLSADTTLNTLLFNSGAAAYTLTVPTAVLFTLAGQGIVNNSAAIQTITNNGGSGKGLIFAASASAENAVITNSGNLYFEGNSTAGNASITNESNLVFQDNSTAGNATILNKSVINFDGNSTGGNAAIINSSQGQVDLVSTGPSLTLGSIAGSGLFGLNSNTLTVGGNGQSTVFSGVLEDDADGGSLVKVGAGTLTLSGANNYIGGTTITAGTLNVTGSLTGYTFVQTGGTLSGTGSVGNVNNRGTVTPGTNGVGTLTTSSYSGSGTLNIPFNGSIHSTLAVVGNADITGETLALSGTHIASGRYDVLTAGSLTGTFETHSFPQGVLEFIPLYSSNGVEMIIHSLYYSSLAQSGNQKSVAAGLDASAANQNSNFIPVANVLSNLSASQTQSAFNQISGDALASFHDVGLQNAAAFTHQMLDHGSSDHSLDTAALAMPIQLAYAGDASNLGGLNSGKPQDDSHGIWARGIGLFERTNGDASVGSPGSNATTGGFQAGYDYALTEEVLLGVAGGYAKTNLTVDDRSSSGDTTAGEGGVYARFTPGPWFFDASLAYSGNSNDNSRTIAFPGISEVANASFNSSVITGFVEAGYAYKPEPSLNLEPSVSLRESHLSQDGYTESGAPGLNLIVGNQTVNSTVSSLGLRLSHLFLQSTSHPFTLGARTAWEHELGDTDNTISAQFADAPGASFTVQGTPRPRNSADLGIDGSETLSKNLQAFFDYSATLGSDENIQAIIAGLRLKW